MGEYSVKRIEVQKNYTRSAFGEVMLCRDLTVTVANSEARPGEVDVYDVIYVVYAESFAIRVMDISRNETASANTLNPTGDTTMWTPVDDVVRELVYDYYDQ